MGVWVKKSGVYKSGKRHYFEDPTVKTSNYGKGWRDSDEGTDYMATEALCGARVANRWYTWGGKKTDGLSVMEDGKVKLASNNLCSYCKKRYINQKFGDQPEVMEVLKAVGVI